MASFQTSARRSGTLLLELERTTPPAIADQSPAIAPEPRRCPCCGRGHLVYIRRLTPKTHVERTSKYTKLAKLPDKNADFVVQACARVLLPLADRIETITYDNGKEFASHAQIATSLGALSYFAKPYHSWERGLNEHTNGLFRQYFPKGSDLSILSDADVQRVEDKLNSRPRKILGYQTPREIFFSARNLPVALHC